MRGPRESNEFESSVWLQSPVLSNGVEDICDLKIGLYLFIYFFDLFSQFLEKFSPEKYFSGDDVSKKFADSLCDLSAVQWIPPVQQLKTFREFLMGESDSLAQFKEVSSNRMVEFTVRLAWIAIMWNTGLIDCDEANDL